MYIKKITIIKVFIALLFCSNSYSTTTENLYKKKYSFSEPVLNEVKALNYIIGRGENPEEVYNLMQQEALQGNEKAQLKLLLLFTTDILFRKAKQRIPDLLNNEREHFLNTLIEMGIDQEKSWAFYEKAIREHDDTIKFVLLNQARNNLPAQLINTEFDEKIKAALTQKIINNNIRHFINIDDNEKNPLKIKKYIDQYIQLKYGTMLMFHHHRFKTKNKIIAYISLKAACDELGSATACAAFGDLQKDPAIAYKYYLKAAQKGDFNAMYNVGIFLIESNEPSATEEGLKWLLKIAEHADGEIAFDAMYLSALVLKNISKEVSNNEKIINLLTEAIKNNHSEAMVELAKMHQKGLLNGEPNLEEAVKLLLKAINTNNPKAMYRYGLLLKKGLSDQAPNIKKGNFWIQKAAELEYEAAMNYMGALLMGWIKGEEQRLNKKEACEWFLKAAEKDDLAKFNAACLIGFGYGKVKPDLERAINILLPAAENKQIHSMVLLARLYLHSKHNKKNSHNLYKKAGFWLEEAKKYGYFDILLGSTSPLTQDLKKKTRYKFTIEKSMVKELYNLACLHNNGCVDSKQNKKEAYRLFLCAAHNDHVNAMNCVGEMLLEGFEDQESNPKEAAFWFGQAAEKDYAPAMVKLAKLFITIPDFAKDKQNLKDALFWLQKAEAMNESEAHTYLETCEKLLNEQPESQMDDTALVSLIEQPNTLQPVCDDLSELENLNEETNHSQNGAEEITIAFSEENNEEPASPELPEILPLYTECSNHLKYKNSKSIRNHFREIGLLKKQQQNKEKNTCLTLSAGNQLIVNMLCDNTIKNKNVDYNQLVNLFNDPYFENQVRISRSKSGCVISAKNYKTLRHEATSTHKKHGQSYDGLNREFTKQLISILRMFDLGVSSN